MGIILTIAEGLSGVWTDHLWRQKRWREVLENFYVIMLLTSGVTFAMRMVARFGK
jgi:hypothetical protein